VKAIPLTRFCADLVQPWPVIPICRSQIVDCCSDRAVGLVRAGQPVSVSARRWCKRATSPAPWYSARTAERGQPGGLGAAPSFLDPSRDQALVRASQAAQFGHGLPAQLILLALAFAGAKREPGGLGQQVGAAACDLPQFRRSGGLLRLSQAAPPGMPPGGAGQRGSRQLVRTRSRAIPGHPARIEQAYGKSKLAKLVSRPLARRKEPEILTPASPDSLPPIRELIADEPFWRYRTGSPAESVAHLRVWLTAGPEPGHLAVVTETGSADQATQCAGHFWAELARR
jgi:hypothetical protein